MGRPQRAHRPSTLSPSAFRRRAIRALLSALAGSGLSAAGLGGPLVSSALAAGSQETSTTQTSTTETTGQEKQGSQQGTTTTPETTTTTSTTPTTTTTSTTPTTTTATTTTPTATTPAAQSPAAAQAPTEAPTVVLQRKQQAETSGGAEASKATPKSTPTKKKRQPNNVAASPQSVADTAALEAILASSNASFEALNFYRIPLFLLPVYKAAAVQYGVPWQILAAINEIETNYGSDLSVSTAGAVGWMQFMPSTWLQYGVDALNAGYADPYNPVDSVFAAARYLRAAGAATNLKAAIFAYNHSEEYVSSVLLRAKLIGAYPTSVVATLTGLIDGRLPVTGKRLSWSTLQVAPSSAPVSSATAGAAAIAGHTAAGSGAVAAAPAVGAGASAPSPSVAAAGAAVARQPLQLADLTTGPHASVVAVQDGRVTAMGHSRKLGYHLVLRDVYGDVFTYAGLGGLARTFTRDKSTSASVQTPVVQAASTRAPAPRSAASAGTQLPVTLQVKAHDAARATTVARGGQVAIAPVAQEGLPAGMNRVRLYARPHNPDARAAAVARAAAAARAASSTASQPLRVGSVVAAGTVLGRVLVSSGGLSGHLRFAVQPAGDSASINPGPVLANWAQLQAALHPEGAKATNPLLGATASDVLLLSQSQLERAVLSDPAIQIYACGRRDIAAGLVNRRVLAVLAFLARSGLVPTVNALRCEQAQYAADGSLSSADEGDVLGISAINGVPIAHHQGPGTITDLTIRTVLSLPGEFVPREILSLMRYPHAPSTRASAAYWNQLELVFAPARGTAQGARVAHSARAGRAAPSPLIARTLDPTQWNQLMTRVAALPFPKVSTKPSSAAVPDPKKH